MNNSDLPMMFYMLAVGFWMGWAFSTVVPAPTRQRMLDEAARRWLRERVARKQSASGEG